MEDWPPSGDDPFEFDTGEKPSSPPPPPERDPFDTGERARRRRRRETGEQPAQGPPETGESPAATPGTGEFDELLDTGEARLRATERGDPFDTGEFRARRAGRPRHRDLPARVRRRQVFGLIGLVALVLVGGYLIFSGGDGGGGGEEQPATLKRLIGQTLIGRLDPAGVDAQLLKQVEKGQLGGVIISTDNESDLARDSKKLQAAAERGGNPELLIMADQEGGHVKRLPGPPDLSPQEIAAQGTDVAQTEGQSTGQYLAGLGVNVNLAPVLDVAHPQTEDTIVSRTYSDDPTVVGDLGAAFITGMQSQRVAATAKHFPGLGLATTNTDFEPATVAATSEELQADLVPFQKAIEAGVDMVMVSTAMYADLSPDKPAAYSGKVIQGLLRTKLGFQGVVITDDLEAPGAQATPGSAALRTLRAGGDLALLARSSGASQNALRAIAKAVKAGRLDQSVVQAAYDRILALKEMLAGNGPTSTPPADTSGDSGESTQSTLPIGLPTG